MFWILLLVQHMRTIIIPFFLLCNVLCNVLVKICNSSAQDFALAAKSVRTRNGWNRIRPLCRKANSNRPDSVTMKPKAE